LLAVLGEALISRRPSDRPLAAVGVTLFGALYAGGLLAFILLLRHPVVPLERAAATGLVFLPLVLIWVCDSLAMAGGSAIGGPKLAPVVSPNKTWAGAVTGSVGAVLIAPVYGWLVLVPLGVDVALWHLLMYGLLVSAFGQAGDLAESLIKREAGVKDSGRFFPGHGGVLDRFDSLYWGIPVAAMLSRAFGVI
jgi:phosphatidate cytidylyltransferase